MIECLLSAILLGWVGISIAGWLAVLWGAASGFIRSLHVRR